VSQALRQPKSNQENQTKNEEVSDESVSHHRIAVVGGSLRLAARQ
jgi:hypothetical protein